MTTTTVAPPGAPAPQRVQPRLRALRYEPEPDTGPAQLALPTGTPGPPPPPGRPPAAQRTLEDGTVRRRAQGTVRLILEVLDGRRPVAHLNRHLEPGPLRYVAAAAGTRGGARRDGSARMRSLRLDQPRLGAAEVAAVCLLGGRIRALAARFELFDDAVGGWRCTALRIG